MPRFDGEAPARTDAEAFDLAREIVGAARNLRGEIGVPPGKRGTLVLAADDGRRARLEALLPHVETLAKMESVEIHAAGGRPGQCVSAVIGDLEVHLLLEGLVDLEKERQRLSKERDAVLGRLKGARTKLANENFVDRAPDEVVQRERDLVDQLEETLSKLDRQVQALESG